MTDNISALPKMLFVTVAAVTFKPISPIKERARQILIFGTSDSYSLNQRK